MGGPVGDFYAFGTADRGGVYVAAGDVTGDGKLDIVAGQGRGLDPLVRVFDGASGAVAREFAPYSFAGKGGVRVGTAFVDDDAYADVVVGTGKGDDPRVRTFSGATGQFVAGPAADFDPGVGSKFTGVNLAAANDPPITSITAMTLEPSSPQVIIGESFSVYGHIETGPTLQQHYGGIDWDGNGTSDETIGGGPNWSRSHTYTTAQAPGSVTIGWVTTAWGQGAYQANGYTSTKVSVAAPLESYAPDYECPEELVGGGMSYAYWNWLLRRKELLAYLQQEYGLQIPEWLQYARPPGQTSADPVRYADGVATITASDLASGGFGGWGQARAWANNPGYAAGSHLGNGWAAAQQPRLVRQGTALVLLTGSDNARFYDGQGTPDSAGNYPTYAPRFFDTTAVEYDATADELVVADPAGSVFRFLGFGSARPGGQRGALASRADAGGNQTAVTAWDALGRPAEVQQAATAGGVTTTESYLAAYLPAGNPNPGRAWTVTLRRKVGAGAWETVRKVEYDYYTAGEFGGTVGDLRRATVTDAAGGVLDQTYYRYYTADTYDGNSVQVGYAGGMRCALGAEAYARLKAAAGGTDADVVVASDATVAQYADNAFEYDAQHRVTKEVVSGAGCSACSAGFGEYTYTYTASAYPDGFNSWSVETVETRPDGSTNTLYTNAYAQVLLEAFDPAGLAGEWVTYHRYDGAGRLLLTARPSAVTGYDDQYADLVNVVGGNAQYLADGSGLVEAFGYYASTTADDDTAGGVAGQPSGYAVRRGETGADVPQGAVTYYRVTAGDAAAAPVASYTAYRNADGTGAQTTTLAYTWQAGTVLPATVTAARPTVTTG